MGREEGGIFVEGFVEGFAWEDGVVDSSREAVLGVGAVAGVSYHFAVVGI